MAASAHLLLSALSKPSAESSADSRDPGLTPKQRDGRPARVPEWDTLGFPPRAGDSAEGSWGEAPLTSEPPLPDAEPLTSEPPLSDAAHLTSEPTSTGAAAGV
ncbi:hypothetical protein ACIPJS_26680 [Streptomyces sp. NPDC086783]|uniref:hypothetical protein n=1 Tax=Streptomyces sp. NPDC086783 TaxID=3365758 RepID=UPI00381976AD